MKMKPTLFTFLVCAAAMFCLPDFGLAAASSTPEMIPAPAIVINPDTYYPLDEVLYLEGLAAPEALVEVRLQSPGAKPLLFTIKSDARGEWVLAEKIPLKTGEWEARARTIDARNKSLVSEWSNPRIFKAVASGISIGGINIKFATLTLVIIVLMIGGAIVIFYFDRRVRKLKTEILNKEIAEAKDSVRRGFTQIRQNLMEELQLLQVRQNLSSEELVRKEQLMRNLENLESAMQNEIDDIKKEV